MLGKPVIITNYATAGSQLQDGVDGVIVPMDNTKCAEVMFTVLENMQLRMEIVKNVLSRDYTNSKEIEKIYNLLKR